jgi:hypothetical protein
MSNKIYQVWGADEEVPSVTSIYYVSSNYDSAIDYVVSLIEKREAENFKREVAFRERKNAKIRLMNEQIRVLDQISDNEAVRPILDKLREKRAKEVVYAKVFGESAPVEHDVDYYSAHFKHYCNKHHLLIAEFELDTGIRACADDYIDEVQGYTY